MNLSDAKIRTLIAANKDLKTADTGGLFFLMKASGSKSWRKKYRVNGREGLLGTGDYPCASQGTEARLSRAIIYARTDWGAT